MPEETLDVRNIHVDEYPKIGEITKIIIDYLKDPNVNHDHIDQLLNQDKDGRYPQVVPTYEKYSKNMTPEIAKLYCAFLSAPNDTSMEADAYTNTIEFLSVITGHSDKKLTDLHVATLIKMINDKKIDENFAYAMLVRLVKKYFSVTQISYSDRPTISTKFHSDEISSKIGPKLLKMLADMPQVSIKNMKVYACSLDNWEEVLKVENDAKQKLDSQLKEQFENVEIPNIAKTANILNQRDDIVAMITYAKRIAPDDKKAEIEAEYQEVIKKYQNDNWLEGNTIDGSYQTKYEQDATKRVAEAEEKASNAAKQLQEKDDKIADLMKQIEKLEAEKQQLEADKQKLNLDLNEQKRKTQDELDINKRLETENNQLKTTNSSLKQQNEIMQGTIKNFVNEAQRGFENDNALNRGKNLLARVQEFGRKMEK